MLSPSFLPFELIIAESIRWLCVIVKAGTSPMLKLDCDYYLHVLELIHSSLGVALPHLSQRLVLVSALLHVLSVDLVHGGLSLVYRCSTEVFSLFDHHYLVISSVGQVILETPQLTLQSLILLCQCQPLLQHKLLHQLTPMMKILH